MRRAALAVAVLALLTACARPVKVYGPVIEPCSVPAQKPPITEAD